MDSKLFAFLKTFSQLQQIKPKEFLFKEGEMSRGIFQIKSGSVIITKAREKNKISLMSFAQKGEVLGLDSFKLEHYPNTAQAITQVEVAFVEKKIIEEIIKTDLNFRMMVLQKLCQVVGNAERHGFDKWHNTVKKKVIFIITELLKTFDRDEQLEVRFPFRLEEVAQFVNIPQTQFSQTLKELEKQNILSSEENSLKIYNFEALQNV